MYKIGEFSTLSKTTIKTLRYYEKEKLLIPHFVDENGYRYYVATQLNDLAKIISLRQIGFSIEEIKKVLHGEDFSSLLENRKTVIENEIKNYKNQLSKINYILGGQSMQYEVVLKELPECVVYYKEGIVRDFSEVSEFIQSSAAECLKTNPGIKCVEPDYCYMNYLDDEFKPSDMKIRYCQAVLEEGTPNETIGFMKLQAVDAVCIYHRGSYDRLGEAYAFLTNYIEENGYEMIEKPRERYIDGIWNKENVEDWVTEIQVPVRKKN